MLDCVIFDHLKFKLSYFEGEVNDDDCSLQFSCLFLKYFPITSQYILCTIGLFSLIGNGIILGTILTKDCFTSDDNCNIAFIPLWNFHTEISLIQIIKVWKHQKHTRERKGPNRQNQENGLIANLYFGSISLADILATLFYLPSQDTI